jgi:molybdate transport repressor ModE-like protein
MHKIRPSTREAADFAALPIICSIPMIKIDIRPVWRFRSREEREFDFAVLNLLEGLEQSGKLTTAAEKAGVSYRHAWNLIEKWAGILGAPLVEMERGRGTRLSPLGARLLWAGKRVQARLTPELDSLASEFAAALNESLEQGEAALRMHASHDFAVAALREPLGRAGIRLDLQYRGSFEALGSLARGACDLAGFHVVDGPFGTRMATRYGEWLKPRAHRLIWLATRTQGLIVEAGNPKGIHRVADLAKPDVRLINRQKGSGTRALLEYLLSDAGIERSRLRGYDNEEFTHAAVAALIAGGQADAGFGVEAAAAQFRLGFVPVATERYFFACRQESLAQPAVAALLGFLRGPEFAAVIASLPGYTAPQAGVVTTVGEALTKITEHPVSA